MSDTATEIQTTQPSTNGQATAIAKPAAPLPLSRAGVVLADIEGLWRFARIVFASGFAPKNMNVEAIAISIQMGLEVGLSPMQAMQSTAVINGRPGIYGDAAKALVEASGLLEDFDEWYEVDGKRVDRTPAKPTDDLTAVCMSKRRNRRPMISTFSVSDAKNAQLWGKPGPWTQYWLRMLRWRARGFNLRDNFGDVLKGLRTVEEIQDAPSNYVDAVPSDATAALPQASPSTSAVTALADKLRQRSENVAANSGHGMPSGEEPTGETVAAVVETKVAAAETANADGADQLEILFNDLCQWINEAEDNQALTTLILNSSDDFAKMRKADPAALERINEAIEAKRKAMSAEPSGQMFNADKDAGPHRTVAKRK